MQDLPLRAQILLARRQSPRKTILFRHTQDTTHPNNAEPDYIIREFAEPTRALDFFRA